MPPRRLEEIFGGVFSTECFLSNLSEIFSHPQSFITTYLKKLPEETNLSLRIAVFTELLDLLPEISFTSENIIIDESNPTKKNLRKRYNPAKLVEDNYFLGLSLYENAFHKELSKVLVSCKSTKTTNVISSDEALIISKLNEITELTKKLTKENKDLKEKVCRMEIKLDNQQKMLSNIQDSTKMLNVREINIGEKIQDSVQVSTQRQNSQEINCKNLVNNIGNVNSSGSVSVLSKENNYSNAVKVNSYTSTSPKEPIQPNESYVNPKTGNHIQPHNQNIQSHNQNNFDSGSKNSYTYSDNYETHNTDFFNERQDFGSFSMVGKGGKTIKKHKPVFGNKQKLRNGIAGTPNTRSLDIFIGGVAPDITIEDFGNFIHREIRVNPINIISNKVNSSNQSFKVTINHQDKDKIFDENNWEEFIIVKPFRKPKRPTNWEY